MTRTRSTAGAAGSGDGARRLFRNRDTGECVRRSERGRSWFLRLASRGSAHSCTGMRFKRAARARVEHLVLFVYAGSSSGLEVSYSRDHYLSEQYLFATGLPCTVFVMLYIDMFP